MGGVIDDEPEAAILLGNDPKGSKAKVVQMTDEVEGKHCPEIFLVEVSHFLVDESQVDMAGLVRAATELQQVFALQPREGVHEARDPCLCQMAKVW